MAWTLLLTLLAVALGLCYYVFRSENKFQTLGLPHIKPLPIFGNMAPVLLKQCALIDVINKVYKLNTDARYVGFFDFSDPVFLIRSPDLIKDIAVKYFDHFIDHRKIVDVSQDPLFGTNLFALCGDKWKEIRNLLSPAFTSSKMKVMFKLMSNCGEKFANYLAERSADGPAVVDTKDAFARYTCDVIATCAFGISVDSMRNPKNDFYVLGRKTTSLDGILGAKFFILKSFPRFSKMMKLKLVDPIAERFFEGIVRETIETRDREGISRPDMMQLMMETRGNKKAGEGPELTIQDMTVQAFSFFFGGFDSSSTYLCFAAYEIAVNPDIQKRLRDEIDAVLEETNGEVTYEAINEMPYFDAVVNEALRKYLGASFLDRLCVKEFELPPALPGGKPIKIQPGDTVWFPVFSIHRDPKYFPNPDTFDPERFMGSRKNDIDPFTYFPFGQGPRMCIGTRFSLLESKVVLFHLLAKCHLKPSHKTLVPLEFNKGSFALTAKGGFWLQVESRNTTIGKETGDVSNNNRTNKSSDSAKNL